ncbi:hypothetical protein [Streptomyces sp. NPDC058092]|uniref:hypothetical protein n=1 Tax=Streptomyces sp. NPDC058092 TaxID=3346336 RepID=UPI0036E9E826
MQIHGHQAAQAVLQHFVFGVTAESAICAKKTCAGGSLPRSVTFFEGNGAGAALLTLWAAPGLPAVLIGGRRRARPPAAPAPGAPEPPLAA